MKAVLGGEGADEIYGGYPTYLGARAAGLARKIPRFIRRHLAGHLSRMGGNVGVPWLVRRLLEGADLPLVERHLLWFGAFPQAEQLRLWRPECRPALLGEGLLDVAHAAARPAERSGDPVDPLLRMDLLLHLPDALLAKVDRATMSEGLEARAPYLERRLVEHGVKLPARWKVARFSTKLVLREAVRPLLPPEVLARRKRGFAVPVSRSLAGHLGDRLLDRLGQSSFASRLFDPAHPREMLETHRAGRADHGRALYALLAYLEWGERWLPAPRSGGLPVAARPATAG